VIALAGQVAYRLTSSRVLAEVEYDGWLVKKWEKDYGDLIVAYEYIDEEWIVSHYYGSEELRREGTGATQHAYSASD